MFTPHDPVHGLIRLPGVVQDLVDTQVFQRLRHIKQLGVASFVYPGATHDRFLHSIGTAFLAHELMGNLRLQQPELGISDRDCLCVTVAALCHDLGHPCFSHTFESFLRALAATLPTGERREKLARWRHEDASVALTARLLEDLRPALTNAGLCCDATGDDWRLILELIDPPAGLSDVTVETWPAVACGRGVEKAWMYEIVSNWRSGLDVDKCDYFRRDAYCLGIRREFDHHRFLLSLRVVSNDLGLPLLAAPGKDCDFLRDNALETRLVLHKAAYQHKAVKKLELHLVDVLLLMEKDRLPIC